MKPASNFDAEYVHIPLSALQHWCYCPRQCALIHVDQVFDDNVHTMRGNAVHSTVDMPGLETRRGLRVERALPIWSERLGLIGKADVVEFQSDGTAYPVEYKYGSRRKAARVAECDEIQLAAQAVCLEEMTGKPIPEGALFYASSKRRRVVAIDAQLRAQVERAVAEVREMLTVRVLPLPVNDERCRACSLIDQCQPRAIHEQLAAHGLRAKIFDPDA